MPRGMSSGSVFRDSCRSRKKRPMDVRMTPEQAQRLHDAALAVLAEVTRAVETSKLFGNIPHKGIAAKLALRLPPFRRL